MVLDEKSKIEIVFCCNVESFDQKRNTGSVSYLSWTVCGLLEVGRIEVKTYVYTQARNKKKFVKYPQNNQQMWPQKEKKDKLLIS